MFLRRFAALVATAVTFTAVGQSSQAADPWSLAAREGGCFPIATLKRKLPDLPAVRDPQAFEAYVRAKGWAYTQTPHAISVGRAIEFTVPSQGLALMFVTSELCAAGTNPGR
jgi:hypothetical protein